MSVLDRKVIRDIGAMRGQVLTIALLIGAGTAMLVMSVGAHLSLLAAQRAHYAESRFADVFATLVRAPRPVLDRVALVRGVATAEARIVGALRVDWPGAETPVAGRVLSLPADGGPSALNRPTLIAGVWPDAARGEEALIHAAFAQVRQVRPGDTLAAILNGRRQTFRIVGVALSPEFVFTARPDDPLPDDRGFVVLWAGERTVGRAFDLEGAFNDVALSLAPGAAEASVISELDRLLEPWGGRGAHGRRDQPSHRLLEDELAEQRTLAVTVPLVFFGIAAFLLNVVLGRMVEAQREQVAALKALGFPSLPIAVHYAKFVALVCALGSVSGVAAGIWLGGGMVERYAAFFRFPSMPLVLPPWLPPLAAGASLAAALLGVLSALRRVLRLPAAEGMRPSVPAVPGARALAPLGRRVGPRPMMVLRGFLGHPLRSLLTVLGIALAVPMVVLGLFWRDALGGMVEVQFDRIERGDAVVRLTDPRPSGAVRELARLPGVLAAEGWRAVPVRLHAGHRSRLVGLTGLPRGAELRVPRDAALRAVPIPPEGVTISRRLAAKLDRGTGDLLRIEVLEGARRVFEVPIAGLADDVVGLGALMEIGALNRLLREDDVVTHVALRVDPAAAGAVWERLADMPRVASTRVKAVTVRVFDEVVSGMVLTAAGVLTGFGVIIAFAVVYNSARVALQERGRQLASLRVLGFTRAEVSRLLLAELALAVLVAVPMGLLLARGIVVLVLATRENETFDLPATITVRTLAAAALVVLGAALASALLVRLRIDRLDLVGALKARE